MQRGFVRKRGASWTAYFYVTDGSGRHQRSKGGFRTKGDALAHLNTVLAALQKGALVEPTKLTVGEYLFERWLPIVRHSLRPSTFDSYQRMIEQHVVPTLGVTPLQRLTAEHLDRLYADLLNSGRSDGRGGLAPKTVRYIHNTLQKALRDAERKQLVQRNVAHAADPPRLGQSGREMKTWTASELRAFLRGMEDHRLYAAYVLAATTGMRRGEVLGLRWRDIEFGNRRLSVRQTVASVNYQISFGEPKTRRSRRSIELDGTTLAALQAHRGDQRVERKTLGASYRDLDLVFAKLDGGPTHPDYFSQAFDRAVPRLGLPKIRLHDLRHTYATLALSARVPPRVISDRLGHATVAFTQDVYTHAIPEMQSAAADQVAELIFGSEEA